MMEECNSRTLTSATTGTLNAVDDSHSGYRSDASEDLCRRHCPDDNPEDS